MDEKLDTFQASCPECGDRVDVPIQDVLLLVPAIPSMTKLRFTCPDCQVTSVNDLTPGWADRLHAHGVTAERVPSEVLEGHSGKPLDALDLRRFRKQLENFG